MFTDFHDPSRKTRFERAAFFVHTLEEKIQQKLYTK